MEHQVGQSEALRIHAPDPVVQAIGHVDQRPVVTRVDLLSPVDLGHTVFLREVVADPLRLPDEGVVLDERVIIQDEVPGEGGEIDDAGKKGDDEARPNRTQVVPFQSDHIQRFKGSEVQRFLWPWPSPPPPRSFPPRVRPPGRQVSGGGGQERGPWPGCGPQCSKPRPALRPPLQLTGKGVRCSSHLAT